MKPVSCNWIPLDHPMSPFLLKFNSNTLSGKETAKFKKFEANKLSLNFDKPHYIPFTTKNSRQIDLEISYANKLISKALDTKFLGIHVDSTLSWKIHIEQIRRFYFTMEFYCTPKVNTQSLITIRNASRILTQYNFCSLIQLLITTPNTRVHPISSRSRSPLTSLEENHLSISLAYP
jgi:hypothetical protein